MPDRTLVYVHGCFEGLLAASLNATAKRRCRDILPRDAAQGDAFSRREVVTNPAKAERVTARLQKIGSAR
jgi:hypothetical protein